MVLIDVEHIPYEDAFDRKNGNEHFIYGIETMQEWIRSQPIVDAVKVVRCKKCKYCSGQTLFSGDKIYCRELRCYMDENDFCSRGMKG